MHRLGASEFLSTRRPTSLPNLKFRARDGSARRSSCNSIAGLTAAYLLRNAGHRVRILEANNYVGGRVHTFRCFTGDLYAEAGAMRIPSQHELVAGFARMFKLPRAP